MAAVANVAINVDSRGANRKLDDLGRRAKRTETAFTKLGSAVAKLGVALAAVQTAKFVFAKTAELEKQTRSLQVLTGSVQKATTIIKELQEIGRVTPFTSAELIDSAKRLNAFGVETEKVVTVTKRLADVSGASGAELSGLVTAYGQVIAKGRLQGEELLQFQERGVALQGELRRMYQLSGDEFTKALSKGRIGAEAVEIAIQNLTDAGGKYANGAISQSDTLSGKFSTLQDGIDRLATNIGTTLAPAIKTIVDLAIQAVNEINILLGKGAEARNFGLQQKQLDQIDRQARSTAQQMAKLRGYGPLDPRTALLQAQIGRDMLRQYGFESGQLQAPVAATTATQTATAPSLLGGNGGPSRVGRGGGGKRTGPNPAEELEQRLKALQRIQTAAQRENELRQQTSDLDSDLLQITYEYRDLKNEISEIVGTSQDAQVLKLQEELQSLIGINEEEEKRATIIEERRKQFQKMADQQKPVEDKLTTFIKSAQERLADLQQVAINISQGIGNAIANSLANGIQGLIDGSQKVKDVFANLLQSVGQILAQEGAKMIATYIAIGIAKAFAGMGGGGYGSGAEKPLTSGMDFSSAFSGGGFGIAPRANGGPVNRNSGYIVGENGPELFRPTQAGRIDSNSDMRSMMSRQRNTAPAMNFTFETTNIGGQEFVSREQLEAAMAVTRRQAASDGAQRGMNMTLDKMQQSPATRRRVGIS